MNANTNTDKNIINLSVPDMDVSQVTIKEHSFKEKMKWMSTITSLLN